MTKLLPKPKPSKIVACRLTDKQRLDLVHWCYSQHITVSEYLQMCIFNRPEKLTQKEIKSINQMRNE